MTGEKRTFYSVKSDHKIAIKDDLGHMHTIQFKKFKYETSDTFEIKVLEKNEKVSNDKPQGDSLKASLTDQLSFFKGEYQTERDKANTLTERCKIIQEALDEANKQIEELKAKLENSLDPETLEEEKKTNKNLENKIKELEAENKKLKEKK